MVDIVHGGNHVEVLTRARDLLGDPLRWCTGACAKDAQGRKTHPGDPRAEQWSIEGILGICDNSLGFIPMPLLYLIDEATRQLFPVEIAHVHFDMGYPEEALSDHLKYESAQYVNEWLGHDAVLQVLDRAIQLAREQDAIDTYNSRYSDSFPGSTELHGGKEEDR